MKQTLAGLLAFGLLVSQTAVAATVTVTIEDPGVQQADLAGIGASGGIVETFDAAPRGAFTNLDSALGTYSAGRIDPTNRFGGANESQYLFSQSSPGSTLSLNTAARYLGFWWSAGSVANQVDLINDGSSIFSFDTDDVLDFLAESTTDTQGYYGNPNPAFQGQVNHEPYVFINMFSAEEFDSVVFSGPNFESDNHTVAKSFAKENGTNISPVPAPTSLTLMASVLAIGAFVARRRRKAQQ
ncbi:MAG: PEP-CTERM sorting domain-containing protein [Pseudomonadota bacterium]